CDSRHYGQNCSRTCSPSCMDQLCDRHDGHCLMCNNTLYGKQCDEKCPRHCLNETCDVYTGKCLACKPDYVGDFCGTNENTFDQTADVAVGVSVGAGVLTFLVIGAAVAVYKRRVKKEKVESKVARNDVAKSENVEHYNKMQDDNYQDIDSVHDHYETMSCVGGLQMESKESQFEMVSFDNQNYSNETYQNVRIKRM
ncbi:cell death abnormality protein 1, partial [Biomphalaria glabrata]